MEAPWNPGPSNNGATYIHQRGYFAIAGGPLRPRVGYLGTTSSLHLRASFFPHYSGTTDPLPDSGFLVVVPTRNLRRAQLLTVVPGWANVSDGLADSDSEARL